MSDNGCQYCSEEFKQFSLEWSFVHKTSLPYYPKGNLYTERAVDVVEEIYSKCKDEFLLELLVYRSPVELFLGCKIATNIPCVPFGTAALMQCLRNVDNYGHDKVCRFEPDDGDFCYVRVNPNENIWEKDLMIRKVIGLPDSYVVEVDGHRYRRNKHDLTLVPPNDDNNDESESGSHQANHDVPVARAVMPTLHPRPQLKFPKWPVQATQQKVFKL